MVRLSHIIPIENNVFVCISNHKFTHLVESTTPTGSPPSSSSLQATLGLQQNQSASTMAAPQQPQTTSVPPNTSSILAALANMASSARQNPTPTPVTSAPPVNPYSNISHGQNNPIQPPQAINPSLPFSVAPQPVNAPATTMPTYGQGPSNGVPSFASNPNPFPAAPPPMNSPGNLDPATQQQVALIKALASSGVPAEQIAGILAAMSNQGAATGPLPSFAPNQNTHSQNNNWGARDDARDRNGFQDSIRSPPSRYRRRSRSPSPQRGWGGRDSPNARRRNDFDGESPARMRGSDDRGGRGGRGRGNDYRQRSPQRRRSNTPPRTNTGGPKWVGHDSSIGKGNIKGKLSIRLYFYIIIQVILMKCYSSQSHFVCWWSYVSQSLVYNNSVVFIRESFISILTDFL